ncbi:MAG: PAS domain-containing protein [Gammaproteobacteria bacterium]|nr:PAS domain-containing protein [Gammaproteobacteria bacterium]MBI5614942.1 PAS domain-containing protein [Gammaproteobacteria bacterium]
MTEVTDAGDPRDADAFREQLRLAMLSSADVFWCVDLDDERRNWMSPGGWALLGLPPGPRVPTLDEALARVHPEDREAVDRGLRAQFDTGVPLDVTFRLVRGDAGSVWLRARARLAPAAAGTRGTLAGTVRDVSDEYARQIKLESAVVEGRMLLRELNHRANNTLQLIISMLKMQARAVPDANIREALDALAIRIKAIGLVNNHLSPMAGAANIALESYLGELVGQWRLGLAGPGDTVHGAIDLPGVTIGIDDAVCLGLIMNELVTNAFKHARRPDRGLTLLITGQCDGGRLSFEVEDDGENGPGGAGTPSPAPTSGTSLMTLMSKQIGAQVVRHPVASGTRVEIVLPLRSDAGA